MQTMRYADRLARSSGFLLTLLALCGFIMTMATPARGALPLELNDRTVSDAVDDEIRTDPVVHANKVNVSSAEGIVTLSGVVGSVLAKERAARIAEGVRGVRAVVNQITVRPYITRAPEQIETAVEHAWRINPATEAYEISVDARKGGAVVLTGAVDSWAEKDLAEQIAKKVAGVTEIKNDIVVEYAAKRDDPEIQAEVEERLRWNVLVDDGLIDVRVQEGDVYLSGTVGSAAEKRQARLTAWVAGVGTVDVSELTVERWARDDDLRNPDNVEINDEAIEAALRDALLYDPRVLSTKLQIESLDGVVILRGTVESLQAKRAAEQTARHTVGVTAVDNRIKVRPVGELTDASITSNLREALADDAVTESSEIMASVRNGVATLRGTVDTYFEKSHAHGVAANVNGVEAVRNQLTVAGPSRPFVYDPYYDPWSPYAYDWYDYQPRYSWKADDQLEKDIETQLWWSPFVDADEVTVTVENGVATLTGTVDTWAERNAARENALEGGATWVENRLKVDGSAS